MSESPIRIAIREEGEWVNAYIAQRETMADAILVATLRTSVAQLPGARAAFLVYVRELARVIVDDALGVGVFKGTELQAAPEHERSGHG